MGMSKIRTEVGRFKMSMHIKVSHAFVDGKPLADAFNNIQNAVNLIDFSK